MEQSSEEETFGTIRRRDKNQTQEFRMDHYRYSVMNMQESADVDLDALLKELCDLEDQLKNGHPFSGGSSSPPKVEPAMRHCRDLDRKSPHNLTNNSVKNPNTLNNGVSGGIDFYEFSMQKAVHFADSNAKHYDFPHAPPYNRPCTNDGSRSPDNDSAFCDNMSILSVDSLHLKNHRPPPTVPDSLKLSTVVDNDDNDDDADNFTSRREMMNVNVNRDSQGLSIDSSTRGSMMTPSPTQLLAAGDARTSAGRPASPTMEKVKMGDIEDEGARLKLEKIKIALEKMKEASIKKIYVKIFTSDGNSKSLLIDERLTIFDVLKILAEKNHVTLNANHSLVEYHPDLLMERIYEDHEKLVENILMWTTDSNNKLYFIERPVKYDIFRQPHLYLAENQTSNNIRPSMDKCSGRRLIEEFFNGSTYQPPPVEGVLYLKQEGKKAWRKKHFVLRASGLYFASKNKSKSSKDLVCLAQLDSVQIYNGIGWKKKYKAPTEYGFALKHPQIQVKASRYIKYLCAEDDKSHSRWIAALRIAKNGKTLYNNYHTSNDHCTSTSSDDFQPGKTSLKLSSSLESVHSFYKDSVVMRPRMSQALTDPDDRPTSIESARLPMANAQSCGQTANNRNSQHKYRTLRSNSVSRAKIVSSVREKKLSTIENQHEQKMTIDPEAISHDRKIGATEAVYDPTPLQKRSGGNGAPKLPLTEQTRQLHCAVTSKYATLHDSDTTTVPSSSRIGIMPPELDSDEDDDDHSSQAFHDLAQSASMTFSTTSTSSGDVRSRSQSECAAPPPLLAELFPPPPSPLPLAVLESKALSKEVPICDHQAQPDHGCCAASVRLPPCTCPASAAVPTRHSGGHQKGPPPAPPKRNETTRLTMTAPQATSKAPPSSNLACPSNGFPSMHLQSYQTAASEYCDIYANSEAQYSNRVAHYFGQQSKKLNAYH